MINFHISSRVTSLWLNVGFSKICIIRTADAMKNSKEIPLVLKNPSSALQCTRSCSAKLDVARPPASFLLSKGHPVGKNCDLYNMLDIFRLAHKSNEIVSEN